mmetsp:Transcript_16937/g.29851  ORF Transcript_16937/g.29851 Transcript_16937/m.29851 type:complete len:327 (-) Transcript_16937:157-1137(-)
MGLGLGQRAQPGFCAGLEAGHDHPGRRGPLTHARDRLIRSFHQRQGALERVGHRLRHHRVAGEITDQPDGLILQIDRPAQPVEPLVERVQQRELVRHEPPAALCQGSGQGALARAGRRRQHDGTPPPLQHGRVVDDVLVSVGGHRPVQSPLDHVEGLGGRQRGERREAVGREPCLAFACEAMPERVDAAVVTHGEMEVDELVVLAELKVSVEQQQVAGDAWNVRLQTDNEWGQAQGQPGAAQALAQLPFTEGGQASAHACAATRSRRASCSSLALSRSAAACSSSCAKASRSSATSSSSDQARDRSRSISSRPRASMRWVLPLAAS